MNLRPRLIPILLAAACALLLAGCANAAGASMGVSGVIFLIALLGLGIAACTGDTGGQTDVGWNVNEDTDNSDTRDAAVDATDVPDVPDVSDARDLGEEGGTWGPCCENGEVSSCYCPAGAACNFGWYTDCGDGTCSMDPQGCGDVGDAGDTSDVADVADTSDTSDAADAEDTKDARDGTWQSCCSDGHVDSCFCPSGMACNYGWYNDCGDGTCVGPNQPCSADAGF